MQKKEVIARKNERHRLSQIKDITKREIFIFLEMMTSISNLQIEWQNSNDIWKTEQAKKQITKRRDDDNDDVEFIVNTADDSTLDDDDDEMNDDEEFNDQANFVSFDFKDEDDNNVDLNDEDNYSD